MDCNAEVNSKNCQDFIDVTNVEAAHSVGQFSRSRESTTQDDSLSMLPCNKWLCNIELHPIYHFSIFVHIVQLVMTCVVVTCHLNLLRQCKA